MENTNKAPVEKQNAWEKAKEKIRTLIGESMFNAWFSQMRLKADESPERVIIEVPDAFFKEWVDDHYRKLIEETILEFYPLAHTVEFCINSKLLVMPEIIHLEKYQVKQPKENIKQIKLNARYRFESFVVGGSNRFAFAASQAVAESPAKTYNPLFIYGGVGLGKTHLLQAICHFAIKKSENKCNICYVSSESFTNDLIDAIVNRSTASFRQKYRNSDILLIDDIQFIAGKESTQEEFFHTFNTLYDNHKQIIITSDRSPKEISNLEERLISRFGWGLITDIQPPDFELRVAILKKKLERETTKVPDDVLEFIAQTITNNVRELEGALIRIIAYSMLEEKEISLSLAKEALKDLIKEDNKQVGVPLIQEKVARYFNILLSDLKKNKRQKTIVLPRQVAMFLSRELTSYSLPEIGQLFGGKDHTTVLYAYKKIKGEMAKNSVLKKQINSIVQDIKN
ncbi:MAG: chromosomal replication initiator protein DnaA [Candidatus Gygaella obscura]|nr:chromosomal replication initiator protein DnaA [Candidatus Gygaella obscura]